MERGKGDLAYATPLAMYGVRQFKAGRKVGNHLNVNDIMSHYARLRDQGIRVFLVRGNHDAESKVRQAITWPDNVYEFSVRKAETVRRWWGGVNTAKSRAASNSHRPPPDDPKNRMNGAGIRRTDFQSVLQRDEPTHSKPTGRGRTGSPAIGPSEAGLRG
jgi:hypothetical protein